MIVSCRRRRLLGLGSSAFVTACGAVLPVRAQDRAFPDTERTRDRIVAAVRAFDSNYALPLPAVQSIKPVADVIVPGVQARAEQLPLIDTFVGDLQLRYSFDSASSLSSVSAADLWRLKLRREELLALAVANFRRRYGNALRVERLAHGVSSVTNAGELEPSLMLDAGYWTLERQRAGVDILAVVPARDTLVFGGRTSDSQVDVLRRIAEQVHGAAGGDAVSRRVFLWSRGRWEALGQ